MWALEEASAQKPRDSNYKAGRDCQPETLASRPGTVLDPPSLFPLQSSPTSFPLWFSDPRPPFLGGLLLCLGPLLLSQGPSCSMLCLAVDCPCPEFQKPDLVVLCTRTTLMDVPVSDFYTPLK